MTTYDIAVQFERGYIADPYWPEIAKVINIGKESGMNRAIRAFLVAGPCPPPPHTIGDDAR